METAGRFNDLQWTGPRSETVIINGVLFPQEFGGTVTLGAVRLAAKHGRRLMLVSLGGKIFGRHAIQKIEESQEYHNRHGLPGKVSYSIELRRASASASLLSRLGIG